MYSCVNIYLFAGKIFKCFNEKRVQTTFGRAGRVYEVCGTAEETRQNGKRLQRLVRLTMFIS